MSKSDQKPKAYDAEALRRKYDEERDKRLRKDAEAQYSGTEDEFEEFDQDPYLKEPLVRDPIQEDVEVAVVGGGFSGLLTSIELKKRGITSFRMIEQAADFGGTWYWNRYPGIRCDIEAYVYMPLLEEVGTVPTERYASGGEIYEHAKAIGRHYGLYDHTLFQTKVESIRWNDDLARWILTTNRGDIIRAQYVTVNQGPLAKVKMPGIPGIMDYQGNMFHAARWDYDYTGGDMNGGMDKLTDKRVAVIGTGATSVQIVPRLAKSCKELLIFQRTPSALAPRNNSDTDVDWFKRQPKGWQGKRIDNFLANITPGAHPHGDSVNDGWTDFFKRVGARIGAFAQSGKPFNPNDAFQEVDFEKMEELRARIPEIVKDPKKADSITPWYNYLCKRPLFSDDYLDSLNGENVRIVDTEGVGVTRIDAKSVYANGVAHEVDCIIFATGFDVGAAAHKVGGYELTGRDGVSIDEKWAKGHRTVHGSQLNGFPNFHIVGAADQGTTAFNYTHTLQMQATHAADIIKRCISAGARTTEVSVEAEDRWLEHMKTQHAIDLKSYFAACTPGFLNNEGATGDKPTFLGGTYGGGPIEFEKLMTAWRENDFETDTDMTFDGNEAAAPAKKKATKGILDRIPGFRK